ncbi:MAG: ribosome assembly RNA-binding protein YhbY [Polyangiaceae bacterium]|nr:ribosome assembly RNA-binding protein YhbY [Polyangiaceae bacterium]MCE7893539.1 ribosome assembly RNA-binding protein YhbY [Sorangiineae bacterium PRO1]MCL4755818.1 ribosome assembly RNA-binding protein YhbY [Myxococcales bacterium]
MSSPLTGKQRRHLRTLAHDLKPVVQIGNSGVTSGVLAEIGRALETHELIKVRLGSECPIAPDEAVAPIESAARAQVAQVIGRTLVVYRRRKKDPKIVLPKASTKK